MEVFDDEHDRCRGQTLERGGDRVEQLEVRTGGLRVRELACELVRREIGENETERGGQLRARRVVEPRHERAQDLGDRLIVAGGIGVAVADERRDPVAAESHAVLLDQRRLADPGRTHDQRGAALSRRGLVIQLDEPSELGPAADEAHARPTPAGMTGTVRGATKSRAERCSNTSSSSRRKRGDGARPELVVEATRQFGVDTECIGLAVAAIQRAHQTLSQAFSQRMLFERGSESVDHQRVLTERESHLGELLDRDNPELLEAGDLRARRTEIACVGQCWTPPQIERSSQQRNRGSGVATTVDLPGQHDEPLETLDVELVGLHSQEIAVRTGGKAAARRARVAVQLEHLTQAGNVHSQCGRRARRRFAFPELVDQLLRGHRPVRSHREQDEKLARFGPRQRDRRPVVTDLGRTEDSKLHRRPRALPPEPTVHRRSGDGVDDPLQTVYGSPVEQVQSDERAGSHSDHQSHRSDLNGTQPNALVQAALHLFLGNSARSEMPAFSAIDETGCE